MAVSQPTLAQELNMSVVESERFESLPISQKRTIIQMRISNYVNQLFELELTKGESDAVSAAGITGYGNGSTPDPMQANSENQRLILGARVDFLQNELELLDVLEDVPSNPPVIPPTS